MLRESSITVYSQSGRSYVCPDKELKSDKSGYVYMPTRGFPGSLTVFNEKGRCVGWMDTRTLGYKDVKAWMKDNPDWEEIDF